MNKFDHFIKRSLPSVNSISSIEFYTIFQVSQFILKHLNYSRFLPEGVK